MSDSKEHHNEIRFSLKSLTTKVTKCQIFYEITFFREAKNRSLEKKKVGLIFESAFSLIDLYVLLVAYKGFCSYVHHFDCLNLGNKQ